MLDRDTRAAILRLHENGLGARPIARALKVSRKSVRKILEQGSAEVPTIFRPQKAEPYLEQVRALYVECSGNIVRVCEELAARHGVELAYSTLTAFCRRHQIGVEPKQRSGRYHFGPGEEMQHDTSPHSPVVGGRKHRFQCASVVLCYSRMIFAQLYPTFNRFWAKVFLTDAVVYFGGAARRCMVDNTSVIIAHGTGKDAVVAPEMEAFGERFDFHFEAHERGDANRSARVERPFHYIENNFYPGRTFGDLIDLNSQLRVWCDRGNASYKRKLRARPIELFAAEKTHMRPLPIHVPEVILTHQRLVDGEGYVTLHTNRYSAPAKLIDRAVKVDESKDRVRIFLGHELVSTHVRRDDGLGKRETLPEHERERRWRHNCVKPPPLPEESVLAAAAPEIASMVERLRKRYGGRRTRQIRRLHRMYLEYPTDALVKALADAMHFGLLDLARIERMVLRNVAGDFFSLPICSDDTEKEDDDDG